MRFSNRLDPAPLTTATRRLEGRVIFVTGASSGIGRAAVRLFAREGALVAAASRRLEQLNDVVREVRDEGGEAYAVECDVTREESVASAVRLTVERFGRLDGAFNNAGRGGSHLLPHEIPTDTFERIFATNLLGPFLCLKYEIPALLEAGGGSIVNTSSIGGLVGAPRNADYASSKWGLAGLTKCAALAYAAQDIRVNAIAPGPTHSEMFDRWMTTPEAKEAMAASFPMNYIAHPDDMARAALFLLSDESRWITGVVLPCEGGASAG